MPYCYHDRLKSTALLAGRGRFDFFTSTLLYSRRTT
ncbi:epoxyqueuosine reductase QueH [Desulfococcus multivorans]|nr:epoxyqueuosine reductase QueH [Desulfococcus multivorans]